MPAPSSLVRVTFPVSPQLSLDLSVLARRAERTRGWLCRKLLEQSLRDVAARYAELEGVDVDKWLADERAAYAAEVREAMDDYSRAAARVRLASGEAEPKGEHS